MIFMESPLAGRKGGFHMIDPRLRGNDREEKEGHAPTPTLHIGLLPYDTSLNIEQAFICKNKQNAK